MDKQLIEAIARAIGVSIGGRPWEGTPDSGKVIFLTYARAALGAITSAGFVVVPREPTPKMVAATWDEPTDKYGSIESQNTRNVRIYKAMLAAVGGEIAE